MAGRALNSGWSSGWVGIFSDYPTMKARVGAMRTFLGAVLSEPFRNTSSSVRLANDNWSTRSFNTGHLLLLYIRKHFLKDLIKATGKHAEFFSDPRKSTSRLEFCQFHSAYFKEIYRKVSDMSIHILSKISSFCRFISLKILRWLVTSLVHW